jgi:cytochrome c-type biogenesis protein CcsB
MTDFINIIIILLYSLSTAAYIVYLFSQKDFLQKTGYYFLLAGVICHSAFIIAGFVETGHIQVHNLRVTLSFASWSAAIVFLSLRLIKINLKILGVYAAPLATCTYILSINFTDIPAQTVEIYSSIWLIVHVIFVFIGEAALALACGVGILYLIQENALKTKKRGFFFNRLPSLELLDSTGYSCIMLGFSGFTIGLVTGFIYSKLVWHHFANWDPKEIWAGVSWLIYAALLHERIAAGWRGRRAAIMAIIGFAALLFTFIGVNFFMEGHHVNFTRWQS